MYVPLKANNVTCFMILTHTRQTQNYKDLQTDDNSTNFKLKIIITLIRSGYHYGLQWYIYWIFLGMILIFGIKSIILSRYSESTCVSYLPQLIDRGLYFHIVVGHFIFYWLEQNSFHTSLKSLIDNYKLYLKYIWSTSNL